MAMSNAERQRRHRQRLKERALRNEARAVSLAEAWEAASADERQEFMAARLAELRNGPEKIHVGYISTMQPGPVFPAIDRAKVNALAESIKAEGLRDPITVYRREIIRHGQPVEGYGLVAGAHRLEACKSLGWSEVPAVVAPAP